MANSQFSLKLASIDFSHSMKELSKLTGLSFADVIRSETKSILEEAVKKTKAAQVKLIESDVKQTILRKIHGKTYLINTSEKFKCPSWWSPQAPKGWRLPPSVWAAVLSQIKSDIALKKQARGLAKKSWLQIAESLGFWISVPDYVKNATTPKGDYPKDATAKESKDLNSFFIELTNSRTYSGSVPDALRAAVRGRTKFFEKNMKLGVFKKLSEIAAKYPGLKVN